MISIVKRLRIHALLSQDELAWKADVTRQMISNYERGIYRPSYETALKLIAVAKEYGLEIKGEDFFNLSTETVDKVVNKGL